MVGNAKVEIPVCLYCYRAVIRLKWGMSDWIRKARCVECGRVFVLDLPEKKKDGKTVGNDEDS